MGEKRTGADERFDLELMERACHRVSSKGSSVKSIGSYICVHFQSCFRSLDSATIHGSILNVIFLAATTIKESAQRFRLLAKTIGQCSINVDFNLAISLMNEKYENFSTIIILCSFLRISEEIWCIY